MITLTIDNLAVKAEVGETILQAARAAGVYIPALCYREGYKPSTSCMVCVVRVEGMRSLVPACGLRVSENMRVTTQSEEIEKARRAAIELLLSDHAGDCVGPCEVGCPANMDIPVMLRQIAAGDLKGAIRTIKNDIALPAILGRICPAPCEKVCRRAQADGAISICQLKRYAADADLALAEPYQPMCRELTGQKAAIVGAGPAGLAAAYYLRQGGVACDVYDEHAEAGGALRYADIDRGVLPLSVVEREAEVLLSAGIQFCGNTRIGRDVAFDELKSKYDAVIAATGADSAAAGFGLADKDGKIIVDRQTYRVKGEKHVFAAGGCTGSRNLCVRAVADGKEAAQSILRQLGGVDKTPARRYNHRLGRIEKERLERFVEAASQEKRLNPQCLEKGYDSGKAVEQAKRCLNCDCAKKEACGLRELATEFAAAQKTWQSDAASVEYIQESDMIRYDGGKCIKCGLCVQAAQQAGETVGLAFEGRGFEMRVAVPYEKTLTEVLADAERYVSVCPTGALTLKTGI